MKSTRLITDCPVQITGTQSNGMLGIIIEDKGNGYIVKLDNGKLKVFYHHQLIPYPDLQTYESYEH